MNSRLKLFTLLGSTFFIGALSARCGCNKPKPTPPQPVVVQPVRHDEATERLESLCSNFMENVQNVIQLEKCGCGKPRPRNPEEAKELVKECCVMLSQEVQKLMHEDYKCGCHKPRPRNKEDMKMLMKECCDILLEEAQKMSDPYLTDKVMNVMFLVQEMDNERNPRPQNEPFIVGPGSCQCDSAEVVDLLQNIANQQTINFAQIVVILQNIVDVLADCCE